MNTGSGLFELQSTRVEASTRTSNTDNGLYKKYTNQFISFPKISNEVCSSKTLTLGTVFATTTPNTRNNLFDQKVIANDVSTNISELGFSKTISSSDLFGDINDISSDSEFDFFEENNTAFCASDSTTNCAVALPRRSKIIGSNASAHRSVLNRQSTSASYASIPIELLFANTSTATETGSSEQQSNKYGDASISNSRSSTPTSSTLECQFKITSTVSGDSSDTSSTSSVFNSKSLTTVELFSTPKSGTDQHSTKVINAPFVTSEVSTQSTLKGMCKSTNEFLPFPTSSNEVCSSKTVTPDAVFATTIPNAGTDLFDQKVIANDFSTNTSELASLKTLSSSDLFGDINDISSDSESNFFKENSTAFCAFDSTINSTVSLPKPSKIIRSNTSAQKSVLNRQSTSASYANVPRELFANTNTTAETDLSGQQFNKCGDASTRNSRSKVATTKSLTLEYPFKITSTVAGDSSDTSSTSSVFNPKSLTTVELYSIPNSRIGQHATQVIDASFITRDVSTPNTLKGMCKSSTFFGRKSVVFGTSAGTNTLSPKKTSAMGGLFGSTLITTRSDLFRLQSSEFAVASTGFSEMSALKTSTAKNLSKITSPSPVPDLLKHSSNVLGDSTKEMCNLKTSPSEGKLETSTAVVKTSLFGQSPYVFGTVSTRIGEVISPKVTTLKSVFKCTTPDSATSLFKQSSDIFGATSSSTSEESNPKPLTFESIFGNTASPAATCVFGKTPGLFHVSSTSSIEVSTSKTSPNNKLVGSNTPATRSDVFDKQCTVFDSTFTHASTPRTFTVNELFSRITPVAGSFSRLPSAAFTNDASDSASKMSSPKLSTSAGCSAITTSVETISNTDVIMKNVSSGIKTRQNYIKDHNNETLEILDDHDVNTKDDEVTIIAHVSINNSSKSIIPQPSSSEAASTALTTFFSIITGANAVNSEISGQSVKNQKVGSNESSFGGSSASSAATSVFNVDAPAKASQLFSQNKQQKTFLFGTKPADIVSTNRTTSNSFSFSGIKSSGSSFFGSTQSAFSNAMNSEILSAQPVQNQKVVLNESSFGSSSSSSAATPVFNFNTSTKASQLSCQNNQLKTFLFGTNPADIVSTNTTTSNSFSFSNIKSSVGSFFGSMQSTFSSCREITPSKPDAQSKSENNIKNKKINGKRKFMQSPNHLANIVPEELALRTVMHGPLTGSNPHHKRMRMDALPSTKELIPPIVTTNESETRVIEKAITYNQAYQKELNSSGSTHAQNLNSCTNKNKRKTFTSNSEELDDEIVLLKNSATLNNVTRLNSEKTTNKSNASAGISAILLDKDNIMSKATQVPRPIPNSQKHLRPIVIDGSNLATQHGKVKNTYSCKGIEISIKYFLRMGHKVTAFVPNSIKYKRKHSLRISDISILDKLAKAQHVIFTPSRRFVGGNIMVCDERRYVVELAAVTDGIILSNHHFEDLKRENYSFKTAIEKRLLMYCFVGDILMIPHDPMGRHGPFLEEFLSFPKNDS